MQYLKFFAIIATAISVVSAVPLSLNVREESGAVADSAVTKGPATDVAEPDPNCFVFYPCIGKREEAVEA